MGRLLPVLAMVGLVWGQQYVGTHKCKTCHSSSKKGAQYKIWKETKHARAFEALLSDAAKKIAAERGMKVPPHEAPECLECHTVGFGAGGYEVKDAAFYNPADDDRAGKKAAKRMENLKNVGCEACHGPGSKYKSMKVMKAIFKGEVKAADYGLTIPDEKTCLKCHNERSPSYKPFDYASRIKEITHKFPEGYRSK
jgi:hypothetical protein